MEYKHSIFLKTKYPTYLPHYINDLIYDGGPGNTIFQLFEWYNGEEKEDRIRLRLPHYTGKDKVEIKVEDAVHILHSIVRPPSYEELLAWLVQFCKTTKDEYKLYFF